MNEHYANIGIYASKELERWTTYLLKSVSQFRWRTSYTLDTICHLREFSFQTYHLPKPLAQDDIAYPARKTARVIVSLPLIMTRCCRKSDKHGSEMEKRAIQVFGMKFKHNFKIASCVWDSSSKVYYLNCD